MYSIITPSFNREKILISSIDSSIFFANGFRFGDELIIIDDASTDNTREVIFTKYKSHFEQKSIQYHLLPTNQGVTFARNQGARVARNEWLVFLDSDDQLLPDARLTIDHTIKEFPHTEVFFFRCVDDDLKLVGLEMNDSITLNLRDYLKHGTYGECLPVIKKSTFLKYPFDEDLRGFEGLSYLKMLIDGVVTSVIKKPARKYSLVGEDRLSTQLNLLKRADKISTGYQRYFLLVKNKVTARVKVVLILKILKYKFLSVLTGFLKKY